jgi:hypothetical protein
LSISLARNVTRRFILPRQCGKFRSAHPPIPDLARRGELPKHGAIFPYQANPESHGSNAQLSLELKKKVIHDNAAALYGL